MPRPGMKEAYKTILAQTYRSITSKERDGRKVLKDELDQIQIRISKARELLLSGDLDAADYKTIKQDGEGRISALEPAFSRHQLIIQTSKPC
jgi:site-specific DNA recombinase